MILTENGITCNRCDEKNLSWRRDEHQSKNRLWSDAKRNWHVCIIKTTVNLRKIFWYCWECMQKVDINNHPCLHYQKLDPGKRSLLRMNPGKKI